MSLVIQRPSRELLEQASANLNVYAVLRKVLGRTAAFHQWCEVLELDQTERSQLAHVRIHLLQDLEAGKVCYDDIDWSGQDEERRASSTGTVFVDTVEGWFE
jgi:hypothetical protein